MMEGEITLQSTLIEALQIMREELHICSKKYNGLEPKEGMEKAWQQARAKVRILQNLLHATESEDVREALGKWELAVKKEGLPASPAYAEIMEQIYQEPAKMDGITDGLFREELKPITEEQKQAYEAGNWERWKY